MCAYINASIYTQRVLNGVPKFPAEGRWGTKAFAIFKMGCEIYLNMLNFRPAWCLGLKITVP